MTLFLTCVVMKVGGAFVYVPVQYCILACIIGKVCQITSFVFMYNSFLEGGLHSTTKSLGSGIGKMAIHMCAIAITP